jgi:hypothetical protein
MDPLSKKSSLVRYGVVLVAMCAVAIGFRGLKPTSFIGVILFALISLKYPFFDGLVRMVRRRWPTLKVLPWLWIGYALAATVDIAATWIAMNDEGGASLALWATILITPGFLIGAFVLMVVHTLFVRKR